ncbi:carbonic anhydrase-related protein 10-like protein [Leptotrombidium deliense]|uniref:Carbonic anhydrase-related protein 10-like protein n=1 Tax=Leptotrombidium deliense TaxID=299467 RepID=A0A443SWN6_9ACAR|nr:carbonic anhydrase-related protein 10-like protein [Leptotrombidium deliense]
MKKNSELKVMLKAKRKKCFHTSKKKARKLKGSRNAFRSFLMTRTTLKGLVYWLLGPDFWGLLNPKWSHCNKGRRQSPIDINPDVLLFDPGLQAINIEGTHIKGSLLNTGRGLKFLVSANTTVIINGGPLSYEYTLNHLALHYGREDDRGSEHTIGGIPFPGELQLYFYNSQLFDNWTHASDQPNGLAAIAILMQVSNDQKHLEGNSELKHVFEAIDAIKFKGSSTIVHRIKMDELLPALKHYITYDGSLTEPACFETVQWILLNKPMYATAHQFSLLRNSIHLEGYGDNFRPIQVINSRCVRTNIEHLDNSSNLENAFDETEQNNVNYRRKLCKKSGYITYKGMYK